MVQVGDEFRQDIEWPKPMFTEVEYEAVVTVKEIYIDKHRVLYDCAIMEPETGQKQFMEKICYSTRRNTSGEPHKSTKTSFFIIF